MKKLLVFLFMFIGLAACAKEEEIFVLPLYMTGVQNNNSYGFETSSEIVADDIIQNFLLGNKINSTKLDNVKALTANDFYVKEAGDKFRKSGLIDFEKLVKSINTTADKTLLVVGYVEDKNEAKLGLWDILKLSSDFKIDYPYQWTTMVVLIDNADGVALWHKSYTMPLASGKKPFVAKNFSEAADQYEKVRSFSKNIIAKDVEQNVILRLENKTIDYSDNVKPVPNEGIGLKYYKKGIPVKITPPAETIEQQLLKDDTFSL